MKTKKDEKELRESIRRLEASLEEQKSLGLTKEYRITQMILKRLKKELKDL